MELDGIASRATGQVDVVRDRVIVRVHVAVA